jgi:hypothetical protein
MQDHCARALFDAGQLQGNGAVVIHPAFSTLRASPDTTNLVD